MGTRNPFEKGNWDVHNPTTLVDRMIGGAYDVVKYVACHMKYIEYVAKNMRDIYDVASEGRRSKLIKGELGTLGSTTTINLSPLIQDQIQTMHLSLIGSNGTIYEPNGLDLVASITGGVLTIVLDPDAPAAYANALVNVTVFYDAEWGISNV